jgi:hypothetical protein
MGKTPLNTLKKEAVKVVLSIKVVNSDDLVENIIQFHNLYAALGQIIDDAYAEGYRNGVEISLKDN